MSGAVTCTIVKDRDDSVEERTLLVAATLFSIDHNDPPKEIELATSVNDARVAPMLPKRKRTRRSRAKENTSQRRSR